MSRRTTRKAPKVQVECVPTTYDIPVAPVDNFWYNPKLHPQWARLPTQEPLSGHMIPEIEINLRNRYKSYQKFFQFPRDLSTQWTFSDRILELGNLRQELDAIHLKQLCNKLTCFYWTPKALQPFDNCHDAVVAAICREWFRVHDDDPPCIQQEYFFAKPIHITPDGPTTVPEIVEAHLKLCSTASILLDHSLETNIENRQSGTRQPDPRHYQMLPLSRAIVVIIEEFDIIEERPGPHSDVTLEEFLKYQPVLLVRTGDESGLSAPISFDRLLPFNTVPSDATCGIQPHHTNAIRVSLKTAVRFLVRLQRREELNSPAVFSSDGETSYHHSGEFLRVLERSEKCHEESDEYVKTVMDLAKYRGIDGVSETWGAVREVKAALCGEKFEADYGLFEFSDHFHWR